MAMGGLSPQANRVWADCASSMNELPFPSGQTQDSDTLDGSTEEALDGSAEEARSIQSCSQRIARATKLANVECHLQDGASSISAVST